MDTTLTDNQIKAYAGLYAFYTDNYQNANNNSIGKFDRFCLNIEELTEGLERFLGGRFKEDGGLDLLQWIFKEHIEKHPHVANKAFYLYSELTKLLTELYKNADAFYKLSDLFANITDHLEQFEDKGVYQPIKV